MNFDSLGMIETDGLVSLLVALSKMLEVGDIKFLKKEVAPNGHVILFVTGNSEEMNRTIQAGVIAAQSVGIVISSGIIPYPNEVIDEILFEKKTPQSKSRKTTKKRNSKNNEMVTLFDQLEEENSPQKSDVINRINEKKNKIKKDEEFNRVSELLIEEKVQLDDKIEVLKKHDKNVDLVISENETETNVEEKVESNEIAETFIEEEQIVSEEIPVAKEKHDIEFEPEINDSEEQNSETENIIVNSEIETEVTEVEESEEIELKNEEIQEEISFEDENENEDTEPQELSHLERLRAEAKAEIENELSSEIIENNSENEPEEIEIVKTETPVVAVVAEEVSAESSEYLDELSQMNVPDLRKLARSKENFPIKGRDISKANKKILLEYFNQIEEK